MIRHCVFVKFRADVTAHEKQSIYDELRALQGHLKGIVGMHFGSNVSPEGLGQGFNDGFVVDFADATARDAYLMDDAHGRAGGRLVAALEGGTAGLVVFDLQI
jgi:hypothetical protein